MKLEHSGNINNAGLGKIATENSKHSFCLIVAAVFLFVVPLVPAQAQISEDAIRSGLASGLQGHWEEGGLDRLTDALVQDANSRGQSISPSDFDYIVGSLKELSVPTIDRYAHPLEVDFAIENMRHAVSNYYHFKETGNAMSSGYLDQVNALSQQFKQELTTRYPAIDTGVVENAVDAAVQGLISPARRMFYGYGTAAAPEEALERAQLFWARSLNSLDSSLQDIDEMTEEEIIKSIAKEVRPALTAVSKQSVAHPTQALESIRELKSALYDQRDEVNAHRLGLMLHEREQKVIERKYKADLKVMQESLEESFNQALTNTQTDLASISEEVELQSKTGLAAASQKSKDTVVAQKTIENLASVTHKKTVRTNYFMVAGVILVLILSILAGLQIWRRRSPASF